MDNLSETETEQLLDLIDVKRLEEEIDEDTTKRIKQAVLQKAGLREKTVKKPLKLKKTRLIAVSLVISIIELLFFTSAAFVAWMNGLLEFSGINLSFGGIIPIINYIIMLGMMSLLIYKAMFHIDSDKYTIDMILPKNRTSVIYSVYFMFTTAIKILAFLAYFYVVKIELWSTNFINIIIIILISSVIFIGTSVAVDVFLSKLKNWIIIKYEGIYPYPVRWRLGVKSLLLEVLKYVGIIGYIIIVLILDKINNNRSTDFIFGFLLFFLFNIFMIIVVQLKKRNSLELEELEVINGKASDEIKANQGAENGTLFSRYRTSLIILSANIVICLFYVLVPYFTYQQKENQKPLMKTFSNKYEVSNFFVNREIPFSEISNNAHVSEYARVYLELNSLIVRTVTFKTDVLVNEVLTSVGSVLSARADFSRSFLYDSNQSRGEHSDTNTQVEGVDEADIIKTDGKYMYYIEENCLYIVEAYPTDKMEIIHKHDFSKEGLLPVELFLYKEHIAIILEYDPGIRGSERHGSYFTNTVVKTYNIKNPAKPTFERSFKFDYQYLTSRMVENNIYLVSTGKIEQSPSGIDYIDTSIGQARNEISYKDLFLMPGENSKDYSHINVVVALPIDKPHSKAQVKAYIGNGGENVYVSNEYLYVVAKTTNGVLEPSVGEFSSLIVNGSVDVFDFPKYGTNVYRIEIQDGNIGDYDSAFVQGRVHNQFSMDEYNSYFRIATRNDYSSSVYVLDGDMKICGRIEGIAPREDIYASRFMGDRLYLVTFKIIDPLFVISLENPKKPTVLGKLKIPGYSEYIHPLDENHIIGFGKSGDPRWSEGVKMAIFDVSDVKNPKEKFEEIIGTDMSDSELLRNHKALMYMGNLGLMAFPVTVYGEKPYQGAYVFNINSDEGFKLRGRITHANAYTFMDSQYSSANAKTSFVKRIIYANQTLYTFSGDKVKATRYSDMEQVSEILLN